MRRTFILRIWLRSDGRFIGQLSDPLSDFRIPFHSAEQLWQLLEQQAAGPHKPDEDVKEPRNDR